MKLTQQGAAQIGERPPREPPLAAARISKSTAGGRTTEHQASGDLDCCMGPLKVPERVIDVHAEDMHCWRRVKKIKQAVIWIAAWVSSRFLDA